MSFLTVRDRTEWIASLDRRDESLQAFAYWIDEICVTALEKTGRELPAEHAAVIVLQIATGCDVAAAGAPAQLLRGAA